MRAYIRGVAIISSVFGVICFLICLRFVNIYLSLALSLFTFFSFFGALSVYMQIYGKKLNRIDIPEEKIIYRNIANYYIDKGMVGNGLLVLTDDTLTFFEYKKRRHFKVEIPTQKIRDVSYGKIFRDTEGVRLLMNDFSVVGFITPGHEFLLDKLNSLI